MASFEEHLSEVRRQHPEETDKQHRERVKFRMRHLSQPKVDESRSSQTGQILWLWRIAVILLLLFIAIRGHAQIEQIRIVDDQGNLVGRLSGPIITLKAAGISLTNRQIVFSATGQAITYTFSPPLSSSNGTVSCSTCVLTNDSRLSDARTPLTHTHVKANITDFPAIPSALSALTDDTTHRLVTDTEKSTWNAKQAAGSYVLTSDSRLSDARTPTAHNQAKSTITDFAHRHDASEIDNLPASGGLPSGMIAFLDSGSCPSGWIEVAQAGKYILLTQAANSDVGTTGGSTSYTPAGTVTSTFTGTQVTSGATSAGTPAGTIPAHTNTQKFTTNTSGTLALTGTATNVFTGTAMATHTHTATAAGTVGSGFAGTAATIQPPYLKLIACKKT